MGAESFSSLLQEDTEAIKLFKSKEEDDDNNDKYFAASSAGTGRHSRGPKSGCAGPM